MGISGNIKNNRRFMNIEELNKKLEDNTNLILKNMNELHSHEEKINDNAKSQECSSQCN